MALTKISNLHIHNSNSKCCWNRYPVRYIYEEAKKTGLKYAGSTNHIYFPQNRIDGQPEDVFQRHILWTKEEIDALPKDIPIYLGCELDIIDETGKHYMLPKYEKMVDYFIAGMHSYFKLDIIKQYYNTADKYEFLDEYFEDWGNWAVNYINLSKPNIFVHPFWQELEFGLFYEKGMMEAAQRIFEAASINGTAIECSSLQIRSRKPISPFWLYNDPRGNHKDYFMKFYKKLFSLAKEYGCMVAFGSDAHIIEQIKDVFTIKSLLEDVGFEDKDIFEPTKKE